MHFYACTFRLENFCFTLICAIHGATVENTLFEDGDSSNTFRAFNPTQSEETYVRNVLISVIKKYFLIL
jgi:hypothetical protein